MLGETLRRWSFWSYDLLLNRRRIASSYRDIAGCMEEPDYEKRIQTHLQALLDHAVENTAFYRELKGFNSLGDFPIVDKNIIRDHRELLMARGYNRDKLHLKATSGSTGTPFKVFQDKDKRQRVLAELIYFNRKSGFRVGEKNAFMRTWSGASKKTRLRALGQNQIMLNSTDLSDEGLEKIRRALKREKPSCLIAYISGMEALSHYLEERGDRPEDFKLKLVIAISGHLVETTRKRLEGVFGCPVISRYSSQENGLLAQEFPGGKGFIINRASYCIEFLELDSDRPAEFGELSRVIVTDLFNRAMPFIRYDTGDLAIARREEDGIYIESIEGRKWDSYYDTRGNLLGITPFTRIMQNFPKLKQYQLVQEDKFDYTLRLRGAEEVYRDEDLTRDLKTVLGEDARIEIQHLAGIPVLASGKFRTTVCNYKKKD